MNQDKILFIASNNMSKFAASVICIMNMCEAFSKNGFYTKLLIPKCLGNIDDLFKYYNIKKKFKIIEVSIPKIFITGFARGRCPIFAFRSINYIKKEQDSVYYTRDVWVFFILTVLIRTQCYYESHLIRFDKIFQTYVYRLLIKLSIYSKNGFMICISNNLKKQWQAIGLNHDRMYVAHDAVNLSRFSINLPKNTARSLLNIEKGRSVVVYTGSLNSSKGVDILIKAANRLPDIYFIIVGGTKKEISLLIDDVKSDNVLFIGHVEPSKVPYYQRAADILALPNTIGSVIDDVTSPMKLFEYIASERPIVSTNIPSIMEILKHEYNALLSEPGDDKELAQNIETLLTDVILRKTILTNLKKDSYNYTLDARIELLKNIFHKNKLK
jgi:glycosyltransferase involved in cell wall biosynthesis